MQNRQVIFGQALNSDVDSPFLLRVFREFFRGFLLLLFVRLSGSALFEADFVSFGVFALPAALLSLTPFLPFFSFLPYICRVRCDRPDPARWTDLIYKIAGHGSLFTPFYLKRKPMSLMSSIRSGTISLFNLSSSGRRYLVSISPLRPLDMFIPFSSW